MEPVEGLDLLWASIVPHALGNSSAVAAPYLAAYYDPSRDVFRIASSLRNMRDYTTPALCSAYQGLRNSNADSINEDWLLSFKTDFFTPLFHTCWAIDARPLSDERDYVQPAAPPVFLELVGKLDASMKANYPNVSWFIVFENGPKQRSVCHGNAAVSPKWPIIEFLTIVFRYSLRDKPYFFADSIAEFYVVDGMDSVCEEYVRKKLEQFAPPAPAATAATALAVAEPAMTLEEAVEEAEEIEEMEESE